MMMLDGIIGKKKIYVHSERPMQNKPNGASNQTFCPHKVNRQTPPHQSKRNKDFYGGALSEFLTQVPGAGMVLLFSSRIDRQGPLFSWYQVQQEDAYQLRLISS
jgi:hypothetical protein